MGGTASGASAGETEVPGASLSGSSPALEAYLPAFAGQRADDLFLTYYTPGEDKKLVGTSYTRAEIWALARRAAFVLCRAGLVKGDAHLHCFSCNTLPDLIFRLASVFVGTVPVTVNWEADSPDRIVYKAKVTGCKLVIYDAGTSAESLTSLRSELPDVRHFAGEAIHDFHCGDLGEGVFDKTVGLDSTRIVIFTSGTTGEPKGVELTYSSYETNRATFEQFLELEDSTRLFTAVVTNPMHHTNSTAITDWALRRPGARLLYVQKYTTNYWEVMATAGCPEGVVAQGEEAIASAIEARVASGMKVVAPLVSKHFDFLDSLAVGGKLPLGTELLRKALSNVVLLVGSAPVGPTTVERLQKYCGCLPTVRFGSTETCLQVVGTHTCLSAEQRLRAFQAGWAHEWNGEPKCGYYIGRPHPGHTEVMVVRSVDRTSADYLVECSAGEPGQLVTRGGNVMSGYVGQPEKTAEVIDSEKWYTNLGDVCFYLESGDDGQRDFYWQGRDSALLIKGGSNYSYEQINAELKQFVAVTYTLPHDAFDIAVVGLRLSSEHEDDCIATIELISPQAQAQRTKIETTFMTQCKGLKKSNKPDHIRFATIPRNFKGACEVKVLKKDCHAVFGKAS
eukprot:TRINITY_DN44366_c0_g1_i1.p1 TRINITY_DN44366_c0_g1~~TRINITY_DN44366_c0_g1_i1.p1  ORF type:complete len:621 (-),score=96.03 TRINITY_DN44366_c0_g1_i1:96-1958(-)